ncbi:MAG: insulinase family protein, partial [bacterium]|nr:insulinase family protein [bacterium]
MNRILLPILILVFTVQLSAQTKVEDVRSFTLDNGMKFFVLEDHSIPNANMYIFWKVGSRNEYTGITGLSHFFEHMMFNGAKKYGPKMFDRTMEANGGSNNAYTSNDITAYTDWFPSDAMEIIFELEADRIADLALDDKMVESERGVIISERITGLENSNYRLLNEQVASAAYLAHPYKWSVIGYESDIKNWRKSDLQRYFDIYYAPNNAVVVMAGDLTFDNVQRLARKYFEPIPANEPPRPVHTVEPEQLGEKRLYVNKNVSTPNLMISYHVPETKSDEYYAINVLNSILSSGRTSRLYKEIIDNKQLAVSIFSNYPRAFDPTLLTIYGICARGVDEKTLEEAIYTEIEKIKTEGVTDGELQKVKNSRLVNFYRS